MSRFLFPTAHREYHGMTRSTRLSLIAGAAVFLTLVSGVSFATWSTSAATTASASTGTVALTTSTTSNAPTITAFGPHTYTAANEAVTKPIAIRNTGTVAAKVSSVTISRTGSVSDDQISVKFWAGKTPNCAASTPVITAPLNDGTVRLSTLDMTVAASDSGILCASTTFVGDLVTQAGRSADVTFQLKSSAGSNWIATDTLSSDGRSFTQSVVRNVAPNAPRSVECSNNGYSGVTVEWSTPSGFVPPNHGYRIYFNGAYVTSTSRNWVDLYADGNDTGDVTIRAVAPDGTESADSPPIPLQPQNRKGGLRCGK